MPDGYHASSNIEAFFMVMPLLERKRSLVRKNFSFIM